LHHTFRSFKSSNKRLPGKIHAPSADLASAFYAIKDVRDEYRKKMTEEREKIGAVKQDKLVKLEGKDVPKLKDLTIRPNLVITRKKLIGTLEAHVNGSSIGVRYVIIGIISSTSI